MGTLFTYYYTVRIAEMKPGGNMKNDVYYLTGMHTKSVSDRKTDSSASPRHDRSSSLERKQRHHQLGRRGVHVVMFKGPSVHVSHLDSLIRKRCSRESKKRQHTMLGSRTPFLENRKKEEKTRYRSTPNGRKQSTQMNYIYTITNTWYPVNCRSYYIGYNRIAPM